jgi:16S rRNA (uracil1498-N3)-methyltransferase
VVERRSTDAGVAERAAAAAQVFVEDPGHPLVADEARHHLERVLRLRSGEPVVVADGRGRWALAAWCGRAELERTGPVHTEARSEPTLTVAFAPVKGDRPEWVVQKLTELGVDRIVPLRCERSVVRWTAERGRTATERLRRVSREAAAQSRGTWLPEVTDMLPFAGLAALGSTGEVALAQLGGDPPTPRHRVVAIGPEGGWTEGELASELPTVGLGPTVLRAETAAVAAGVLLAGLRSRTVSQG